jgi:hypothetical protein
VGEPVDEALRGRLQEVRDALEDVLGRSESEVEGAAQTALREHFKTPAWVSYSNEHGARMKEANVEYCSLHTRTASVAEGFEMLS